jgi:NlpC/P60 family putative phage cell wall peptidase
METNEHNFRQRYAEQARTWLGVPYEHRGVTRGGCDCTGLLIGVARDLGYLKNYRLRKYPVDWNLHGMADNYIAEQLGRFAIEIPNGRAEAGDILIFHFGKCLAHCGILVDAEKMLMIHCYRTSKKVALAVVRNSHWSQRWAKTYRLDVDKLHEQS